MTIMTPIKNLSLALGLMASAGALMAAELAPGDVINAGNLDQRMSDTFEGNDIGSLLTDVQKDLIRSEGLVITLKASEEMELGKDYVAATEKYSDQATFNPDTRMMEGWVAGVPFPNVTEETPHAAEKLIWNHHVAQPTKNFQDFPFAYTFVDDERGLERKQEWVFQRYYMKGRLGEESAEQGDGDVLWKQLLYATYPNDIRGLGLFTVRYDSPKLDDSWAYLKSVRRTRRLSGGTWMDPIGGTDQLNDDIETFNAHPTWYPEYKLLGKRTLLVVANSQSTAWNPDASSDAAEFPIIDLNNKPYWNPQDQWEPREVWVIEAVAPPEHPYSRKVLYMDAEFPRFYMADVYDRKGEFWKWMNYNLRTIETEDGDVGMVSNAGFTIDYQRRHATIFVLSPEVKLNTQGFDPDDISLRELEQAAAR